MPEKTDQLTRPLSSSARARLYWQCRRGMLELDLLLQGFFEQKIDSLNEVELQSFDALLRCADDQLYGYLLGQLRPSDKDIAHVVRAIRSAASTQVEAFP